jgi:hypothetical protein
MMRRFPHGDDGPTSRAWIANDRKLVGKEQRAHTYHVTAIPATSKHTMFV